MASPPVSERRPEARIQTHRSNVMRGVSHAAPLRRIVEPAWAASVACTARIARTAFQSDGAADRFFVVGR